MRTLKFLSIIAVFTVIAAVASANEVINYKVESTTDLTTTIRQMIKDDYVKYDNYFNQNEVYRLKEDVSVVFYVTKEQRIKVLSVTCENSIASEYVKLLLNDSKIKADENIVNKKYRLEIKLDYRT